ncbi:UNVERIFIED_CONTAM: hypothetical protein PYX00_007681 [Menopon gallinae]|uniref:Enolase-phosphatase E1 n=1 Tax=Menopon gallinae TaxID=328185 RepID=A0AAW2HKZ1_9NEOP
MVSGEKRNNEEEHLMEKITTILLDIEGTTTSVSFVKDTLFPYVKEHLGSYVDSHWEDSEFKEDVAALKEQAKNDEENKVEGFCQIEEGEKEKESLIKNVLWQMSLDRKTTALKQLQGHIWREGYKNGKLKGHIYSDVVPALKKWREESRRVYIFSSGSVEAQKLLFGHSEEGDLLEYISGHFDTTVGPKNESSSYANIIKSLECEKDQILFLTDVVKEAEAARAAGMQTTVVIRENNAPLTDDEKKEFMTINSFNDLVCENSAKRKKISNNEEESAEKTEKVTAPTDAESEKSHVNGNEEMDVDVTNEESKSECTESNQEKTADKTEEEESKTESEDVEIDVVSEDKKEEEEENVDVCANGDEAAIQQESEGKEADSEPQVDVTEPAPVAADPLDISSEKPEEEETPKEKQNGSAEEAEAKVEVENGEEPEQKTEESEASAEKVEGKELNGQTEHVEAESNGVEEESIPVAKIVAEDIPEPTVEVKA